jgi:sulfonate transport system permease protein
VVARALIRWGTRLWFPTVAVILWSVISAFAANPFFPSPLEILRRFSELAEWAWLVDTVLPTVATVLIGYSLGVTLALVAGIAIGGTPVLNAVLSPLVVLIRSTPSAAKVPIIMTIMGVGRETIVAAVTIAVAFQMMLVVIRGIESTRREHLDISRLNGLSWLQSMAWVRTPAAAGEILTGLYLALQIAMLVTVVSEVLGSSEGLGVFILTSMGTFRMVDLWVGVSILGLLGYALHETFGIIERRVLPWYHESRGRSTR